MTPGNDFFGHPKNHQKSTPQKTYFFLALFFQTRQNDEKDAKNEGHLGSLLGSFFEFFQGFIFSSIFSQFSTKKIKNGKMKKLVWIRKLRCFVRVARLKKTREALENCDEKNIDFSWKIDPVSGQKTGLKQERLKNRWKNVTWPFCESTGRFLVDFGDPRKAQKWSPSGGGHWGKPLF